jgi:sugar lactone lactonase YvrE
MTVKAEPVVERRTSLGESAFWYKKTGTLLWVDINKGMLFDFDPESARNTAIKLPGMVGTVVTRSKGGIIAAMQNTISAVEPGNGNTETLLEVEADRHDTRFNDGKCDPAGRFWAGTMSMGHPKETGTLYRLDTDLSLHAVLDNVKTSNGLLWTSDAETMYYSDTPTYSIDAFDYDIEDGSISNRRPAIEVPRQYGGADGLAIDTNDNIWSAHYGGGCVRCWNPQTGKLLETVEVPGAKNVTSCAFGGDDYKTLYITTASQNMDEEELTEYPNSGFLFAAAVTVPGRPFFEFGG